MPPYRPSPVEARQLVRQTLCGAGLTEAVTPALVSGRHIERARLRTEVPSVAGDLPPGGTPVVVTNPLSRDHSILRQSLLPSLLDVVGTNLRQGTADVAIFEIGKGYARDGDRPREWWRLGLALVGAAEPPHHAGAARAWDLDDAKGLIELLCRTLGLGTPRYRPETSEPSFHAGRTARAELGDQLHAIVGEAHPSIVEAWELRTQARLVLAEIALAGLSGGRVPPEQVPALSRFPAVERDVALVLAGDRPAAEVEEIIRTAAGDLLRAVRLFDIYRGAPLAADDKSLAYRLTFQAAERTLTEAEIDAAVGAVTAAAAERLGARLRS
jgi:phenylalanyl-tRNA synthetase beta chain